MTDRTLGIIYAIKQGNLTARQNIVEFMSRYDGVSKNYYCDANLIPLIEETFLDYLETADDPVSDVRQYFASKGKARNFYRFYPARAAQYEEKQQSFGMDTDAVIAALCLTDVMKDGKYVNGFRELKED